VKGGLAIHQKARAVAESHHFIHSMLGERSVS